MKPYDYQKATGEAHHTNQTYTKFRATHHSFAVRYPLSFFISTCYTSFAFSLFP